jgi:cytosine/adenosine deaminase-related metal-dependent hydrolase
MKSDSNHGFSFKPLIMEQIKRQGGWVNAHAHADRAFTVNPQTLDLYRRHNLMEKWDLVDEVKRNASIDDYYDRFCRAFEVMIGQGVSVLGSFVDVDPVCEDRAILGGLKAREQYQDQLTVRFALQTLKGVIEPQARQWFEVGVEMVDIIGGLPKRDERDYGKGSEHMDILLEAGKRLGKPVHVHVDQFNTTQDKETEQLCDKTLEHDMVGRVTAIHCISLAAHKKSYREKVYRKMKKAGMMVIACPVAWIDSPRHEKMQPFHNALTPIDELIPHGITVALGTDNICDYMVPFCDGDMWQEFSLLAAGNRYVEIDELVKVATINGRRVLDLPLDLPAPKNRKKE